MIRIERIPRSSAWTPSPDTVNSFSNGMYRPCKIVGAARLVRLLSHAGQAPEGQMYKPNLVEGSFWFDEQDYLSIKFEAEADLRAQAKTGDPQGKLGFRIGMYLRHQFRNLLAVRRDWTPSFDYYILLDIPANNAVIALEGFVAGQPVYTDGFSGGAEAKKAKIGLAGGLKQYVIDFSFPPNRRAVDWIVKSLRPIG